MECEDPGGFSEAAREHAEYPRNYGPLDVFDARARITGPCGDTMEIWIVVRGGKIEQAYFTTDGCGSSVAAGSAAVTLAERMPVEEAARLGQAEILEELGGLPEESEHCALLAANTLKAACEEY